MSILDDIAKVGDELDRARKDYARACQAQQDSGVVFYEKFHKFSDLCRQLNAQSETLVRKVAE